MPLDLTRPEGKKIYLYAIQSEKIAPLTIGTFNHHLTFSNVFLLYAILFGSLGLFLRGRKRWLGLSALLFLDCLWTESRVLWVTLPIVMLILVLPLGWKKVGGILAGLAAVFAEAYFADAGFRKRLTRTLQPGQGEYSLIEREKLWTLQLDIFKQSPIVGARWNNNERFCNNYYVARYGDQKPGFCGHAHSMWLQILSNTGILGVLAFLWCFPCVATPRLQAAATKGQKNRLRTTERTGRDVYHIPGAAFQLGQIFRVNTQILLEYRKTH